MIVYLDRSEVPDLEQVPSGVLRWLVRRAELAEGRYDRLWRYYLGRHDIFRQRKEGEVQVAVNYAKYVVDIALNYYLGRPVKYDPNQTDALGRPVDLGPLLDCYERQHIAEVDLAIGRTMGVMGDCLELCYASSGPNPVPKSARIDPRSGILVCDTTVEHAKLFALVWERREKITGEDVYKRQLKSHPVCMVADGPMSLEMEKYLKKQNADMEGIKAERVLEVNPDAPVFAALQQAIESDPEKAKKYAQLLYCQALLIADLPLEDPSAYTDLVCSLMV